jgi:hypothetical protein
MRAARERARNVAHFWLQSYFEDGVEFFGWTICADCDDALKAEGFPHDNSLVLLRGDESLSPWGKRLDELGFMTSFACRKCLDDCLSPKEPQ